MGVRDGLPVRPAAIPGSRPRVAGELGRIRSEGRNSPERRIEGRIRADVALRPAGSKWGCRLADLRVNPAAR